MAAWKELAKWTAVGTSVLVVLGAVLSLPPGFEALPQDASVFPAGTASVDGGKIAPFEARYRTRTTVLGIPVKRGEVTISAQLEGDSLVGTFAGSMEDRIVMDPNSLRPRSRSFGRQSFDFHHDRVDARVTRGDGTVDTLSFPFDRPPFEVSLLEWVVIALGAEAGDNFRLVWDNFNDPDGRLVDVRRKPASGGGLAAGFAPNEVLDLRFSDGRIRRYWLTDEPPYKVRQKVFERGRLVVSTWELVEVSPTP